MFTTACEDGAEYNHITTSDGCEMWVVEKSLVTSYRLYYSKIKLPLGFVSSMAWKLEHLELMMMQNIIISSIGHGMKAT